ncbi:hypothetical protein QEH52_15240 [Coraliomargarita sp. SDUM461003]|uniref:Uncharacterized protein n=1 Tax=Thalassobacterium maritimum TaxID=3041265 RepID=A0ABU1AXS1_9BACT|nr:hypothetical protein [Coraliomargarita sp. SDUM461003]MDQ8208881.1 hypothetical protein [Coraliomargarita sp. SDUM461003]
MSTLVSVETNLSSSNKAKLLAQENARLGITIALGELQKYTGVDQSITARSDMDVSLVNTTDSSGHWLGAYRNGAAADYTQQPHLAAADIVSASDTKGSQAKLMNWLISGNEGLGDRLNIPSALAFTPNDVVANLTGATAISTNITVADQPARLLVGPNTVGDALVDYVAAPLQQIAVGDSDSVSGYAWWISDEASKARVNLPMPSTLVESQNAFVSTPRTAIELMDAVHTTDQTSLEAASMLELDPTGAESAYDPSHSRLLQTIGLKDLTHLTSNDADVDTLEQLIAYRYHDLTAYSSSLITDSYAGGMKQDLSALLATGATTPADDETLFATVSSDPPGDPDFDFDVPTWGQLRSFAQTSAGSELTPRLPSKTAGGISPVLTYLSLGFQYVIGEDGSSIELAVFPIAVLWNPYTTPIKAHDYEVGFQRRYSGTTWMQLQEYDEASEARNGMPWKVKETRSLNRAGGTRSGSHSRPSGSYFRFVVRTPTLQPGESYIYSLQGAESGKIYQADSNGEPQNILTQGFNPSGYTRLSAISSKSAGTDENTLYRVAIVRSTSTSATKTIPSISGSWPYAYIAKDNLRSGEACAYLGEVVSEEPLGYDATSDGKRWYQSFTRLYAGTNEAYSSGSGLIQGPAPLSSVTQPVFAQTVKAQFSHSGIRWIAQSNPRAMIVMRQPRRLGSNGDGIDSSPPAYTASSNYIDWPQFIVGVNEDASSGYSLDAEANDETIQSTLFEFRPDTQSLLSLGQLQHAHLGYTDGHPSYAIGNSLADYRLASRDQVLYLSNNQGTVPTPLVKVYYDYSWNLNRSLFDRYFFSSVPHAGTGAITDDADTPIPVQLPNSRIQIRDGYTEAELKDASLAATHLELDGGFNINSTSEQAWRAVLGGINKLAYDPVNENPSAIRLQAALARFSKPTLAPNSESSSWQGFRQLDEEQIAQLARNIVAEIRNRGPFVSMADFVNRRLVDSTLTASVDERLKGTLQAAIDAITTGPLATNSDSVQHLDDAPSYSKGSYYDLDAMRGGSASVAPYSSKSAFAPQFLTQADILSAVGSTLTARSDTFKIRSYGEIINPVTQEVDGRAWCEAIVQRTTEYVDSSEPVELHPSLANEINQSFGRKYKIVKFRWLSSEEI